MSAVVPWMPGTIPFCEKCQRHVDMFEVEAFTEEIANYRTGWVEHRLTGQGALRIECHVEKMTIMVELPR